MKKFQMLDCAEKYINEEQTAIVRKEEKYYNFNKWLKDNGAKFPKIEFPTAYGPNSLLGVSAKEYIPPNSGFLYIPNKCLISNISVRKSEIKIVYEENNDVFEDDPDGEYLSLMLFLLYEKIKGKKSFWHPYFEVVGEADLPAFWNKLELEETEDPKINALAYQYSKEFRRDWMTMQLLIDKYPCFFEPGKITEDLFAWAFKAVITRCFGWFLPTNMIIPLADHLNHSAVDVHYELYHKYKHWEVTQDVYHTKEKMKQDFSDYDLVEGEMGNIVKPPRPMCKKIFVDDKMDSVHIGPDQDFDMQKLHKDQQIWNVSCTEDDDSEADEEEESGSEGSGEENASEEEKKHILSINGFDVDKREVNFLYIAHALSSTTSDSIPKVIPYLSGDTNSKEIMKGSTRYIIQNTPDDEDSDEEEDFAWYSYDDPHTYFALCTKDKTDYQPGQQVFNCYGNRSNQFLLLNYGFTLEDNKYNVVNFRVWLPSSGRTTFEESGYKLPQLSDLRVENMIMDEVIDNPKYGNNQFKNFKALGEQLKEKTKIIRLKTNKLPIALFAYLRLILLPEYKGKNKNYILVKEPVDVSFEIVILASANIMLRDIYMKRFKTSITQDRKLLRFCTLSNRRRFAIMHRMTSKDIILTNIKRNEALICILQRFHASHNLKDAYSQRVPESELTETVITNRRIFREYFRELYINSIRILGGVTESGGLTLKQIEEMKDVTIPREHLEEWKLVQKGNDTVKEEGLGVKALGGVGVVKDLKKEQITKETVPIQGEEIIKNGEVVKEEVTTSIDPDTDSKSLEEESTVDNENL